MGLFHYGLPSTTNGFHGGNLITRANGLIVSSSKDEKADFMKQMATEGKDGESNERKGKQSLEVRHTRERLAWEPPGSSGQSLMEI